MRKKSPRLTSLPDAEGPLYGRVYRRLRSLILDGTWRAGQRLPSSRALAADLGISRNTAMLAVEQLIADGWVITRAGAGAFVSDEAPLAGAGSRRRVAGTSSAAVYMGRPGPFEISPSSVSAFSCERWARLQSQVWADLPPEALFEGAPAGVLELRTAIAELVCSARGIDCEPDQIIVTASSQACLDLTLRSLTEVGDRVLVEDPGYPGAKAAVLGLGLRLVPVPVDENGMRVRQGKDAAPDARLAYVTPAMQFPTCVELAPERRRELFDWARSVDGWIIEDDYDAEARFDGTRPPPSLFAEDESGRIIYISSFNRTLFPSLRIAFLVAPRQLVARLVEVRRSVNPFGNIPNEIVLARFIDRGHYSAHLRSSRQAQAERRSLLAERLRRLLPPGYHVEAERNGLHLAVRVPCQRDAGALAAMLRAKGLMCYAESDFADGARARGKLLLGFAAFEPEELAEAADRLCAELQALHDLEECDCGSERRFG